MYGSIRCSSLTLGREEHVINVGIELCEGKLNRKNKLLKFNKNIRLKMHTLFRSPDVGFVKLCKILIKRMKYDDETWIWGYTGKTRIKNFTLRRA
jgi:hypothetical protein